MQVRAWMVDDAVDRGDCMDARRPEHRGGRSAHSPDGHGRVRELVAGDPTTAVREAPREFVGDDGSGTDSDGGCGGEVVVIPGHARPTASYMHRRTHGARSNVEFYGRDQRVSRRQWRRQHEDAEAVAGATPCQAAAISTTGSVSICFPSVASVPTPTPGGAAARRSTRHGAPRGASEAASPPPSLRYGAGAGTAAGSPAPLPSASPVRRIFGDGDDDVGGGSEADAPSHASHTAAAARPSPSPSPSPFRTLETENEHLLSMVQVLTRHVADLTGHVARQSQEVRRLRSSSPSLPPQSQGGAAAVGAASPAGAERRTHGQDRRMSPELTNEVPPPFTRNSRW